MGDDIGDLWSAGPSDVLQVQLIVCVILDGFESEKVVISFWTLI